MIMSMVDQVSFNYPKDPILLGKFGRAYGVMGWLKIISLTENFYNIVNYQPWFVLLFSEWLCCFLENWRYYNNSLIVKIKGIKSREAAFSLTNLNINIDISQLPLLKEDEYYWKDLMGCQVFAMDDFHIGEVINLIETGANDVLVVQGVTKDFFGIQEYLIPFIEEQVIKNVNVVERVINVDWDCSY